MVDIPLATPTSPPSLSAATASSQGQTLIQVAVTGLPAALENLTHTIQTNAVLTSITEVNSLSLTTVLGLVSVTFAQNFSAVEKSNLLQHLVSLMQSQRPLTLTVQPGSPPTQGILAIPTAATPPQQAQTVHAAQVPPTEQQLPQQVFKPGAEFRAIVLPPTPAPTAIIADASQTKNLATTLTALRTSTAQPETENAMILATRPRDDPAQAFFEKTHLRTLPQVPEQPLAPQKSTSLPPQSPLPLQETHTLSAAVYEDIPEQPVSRQEQPPLPHETQTTGLSKTQDSSAVSRGGQTLPATRDELPAYLRTADYNQKPNVLTSLQEAPAQEPPVLPAQLASTPDAKGTAALPLPQPLPNAATRQPALDTSLSAKEPPPQPAMSGRDAPLSQGAQQPVPPHMATLLTPGNEVSLRLVSILQNPNEPPPVLAPGQIAVKVAGVGTNGQLILDSPHATLFVKAQVPASIGETAIVAVTPLKDSPLMPLPSSDKAQSIQSLAQALAVLEHLSPRVFHNVMMNFLPHPTEALPGALLFLFSAFKNGDVRGWIGSDAVDMLASLGKASLVDSLSNELKTAGQPAHDTVVGEWKAYPIPLFAQDRYQSLTLYVHADRDARKEASVNPGKIRFLIDMNLSKLGAMQIDGFVQPKKLDMVLRSENILPDGLHRELRDSYIKALEAVGFSGTLNFQVGRQNWMIFKKDAPKEIVT